MPPTPPQDRIWKHLAIASDLVLGKSRLFATTGTVDDSSDSSDSGGYRVFYMDVDDPNGWQHFSTSADQQNAGYEQQLTDPAWGWDYYRGYETIFGDVLSLSGSRTQKDVCWLSVFALGKAYEESPYYRIELQLDDYYALQQNRALFFIEDDPATERPTCWAGGGDRACHYANEDSQGALGPWEYCMPGYDDTSQEDRIWFGHIQGFAYDDSKQRLFAIKNPKTGATSNLWFKELESPSGPWKDWQQAGIVQNPSGDNATILYRNIIVDENSDLWITAFVEVEDLPNDPLYYSCLYQGEFNEISDICTMTMRWSSADHNISVYNGLANDTYFTNMIWFSADKIADPPSEGKAKLFSYQSNTYQVHPVEFDENEILAPAGEIEFQHNGRVWFAVNNRIYVAERDGQNLNWDVVLDLGDSVSSWPHKDNPVHIRHALPYPSDQGFPSDQYAAILTDDNQAYEQFCDDWSQFIAKGIILGVKDSYTFWYPLENAGCNGMATGIWHPEGDYLLYGSSGHQIWKLKPPGN